MPEDPQTLAERREAVDAAHVLLLIASGRTYSLMTTTLDIHEARCEAILPAGRYHCDACGWDGEEPGLRELQGEGCGGVLWTLRVCPACGEDASQTVLLGQEDSEEGTPSC